MSVQQVTLSMPGSLYERISERAERRQHSIEHETLELLTTAVPATEHLPSELSDAVRELALLDDDALWRAARSRLDAEAAAELESLHLKQQRQVLTAHEQQMAEALIRQYERAMLVRARAAELLKTRGHDITSLLAER
jgi:hypothetical protein